MGCLFLLQNCREEGKCFETDSLSAFLCLFYLENERCHNNIPVLGLSTSKLFPCFSGIDVLNKSISSLGLMFGGYSIVWIDNFKEASEHMVSSDAHT